MVIAHRIGDDWQEPAMSQDRTLDQVSRLLLRCLAGDVPVAAWPEADDERVWGQVVARALRLGMAPLLYRRLQPYSTHLPAAVLAGLEQAYWATAVANTCRLAELQRIVGGMAAAQVPVILLKGAILAETIYPDVGTRPMGDLDLLIPPAQVEVAEAVLEQLGYTTPAVDSLGHSRAFLKCYGGELTFYSHEGTGTGLDLHWRLIHHEGFRDILTIDSQALWLRACPVPSLAGAAWQLSVEDTLLYLALHLAVHHRLSDLRMFLDVDQLIRASAAIRWPEVVARATEWRVRHVVYMTLMLCRQLFATPVPPSLFRELRPSCLRLALLTRLVGARQVVSGTGAIGSKGERLLHLLLTDRMRDLVKTVVRALWPSGDWIRARYGPPVPRWIGWCRIGHLFRMARYALLAIKELVRANVG